MYKGWSPAVQCRAACKRPVDWAAAIPIAVPSEGGRNQAPQPPPSSHTHTHTPCARPPARPRAALSSVARPGFFLSFYFFLDAAAVLSLGFELPALRAALALGPRPVHIDLADDPDSILRALGNQVGGCAGGKGCLGGGHERFRIHFGSFEGRVAWGGRGGLDSADSPLLVSACRLGRGRGCRSMLYGCTAEVRPSHFAQPSNRRAPCPCCSNTPPPPPAGAHQLQGRPHRQGAAPLPRAAAAAGVRGVRGEGARATKQPAGRRRRRERRGHRWRQIGRAHV